MASTRDGRREANRHHPRGITVPYCPDCRASLERQNVRSLAWDLASVLLGLVASAFVPMLPWLSKLVAIFVALAVASLPGFAIAAWHTFWRQPALLEPRAVIPVQGGFLCLNEAWAQKLSAQLGAVASARSARARYIGPWAYGGVVLAALLAPWLHDAFHPMLRILNLTEDTVVVSADNHALAKLEPTSTENPRAGALTRIPAGHRRLEARRTDGVLIEALDVNVIAGRTHLFAPGRPSDVCFWLEQTLVGRDSQGKMSRSVLGGTQNFWSIQPDVDMWFVPAPRSDSRLGTGGTVTSLRLGTCSRSAE